MNTSVKEEWLHFLWKMKRLPVQLKTTTGLEIQIINWGIHNFYSGPDFFNAQIKIGSILWTGNVEIHVKASDWNRHQHQIDTAYENVILHVVYENDAAIFIQNELLPVLELKTCITLQELEKFAHYFDSKNEVICTSQWKKVPSIYIHKQLEALVFRRIFRKMEVIQSRYVELQKEVFFLKIEVFFKNLMTKVNELPAIELLHRIPITVLFRLNVKQRTALLFAVADLIPKESVDDAYVKELRSEGVFLLRKYNVTPMDSSSWKFFGCRPSSYPTIRLVVFSHMLDEPNIFEWKNNERWIEWFFSLKITLPLYWKTHYHFGKQTSKTLHVTTASMKSLLIINFFVPFIVWQQTQLNLPIDFEKVIGILEKLPPEKNKKIDLFINLGEKPKSAYETQGFLELLNEFCKNHQCLSCQIGTQLFKL